MLEAASLVGQELWDSTRARLFEGDSVSVLMSSRRNGSGTSDVWVTIVTKAAALDAGRVDVTLIGADGSFAERLDVRGRCVIRGVPDGQYRIGICRQRAGYASVLLLPLD